MSLCCDDLAPLSYRRIGLDITALKVDRKVSHRYNLSDLIDLVLDQVTEPSERLHGLECLINSLLCNDSSVQDALSSPGLFDHLVSQYESREDEGESLLLIECIALMLNQFRNYCSVELLQLLLNSLPADFSAITSDRHREHFFHSMQAIRTFLTEELRDTFIDTFIDLSFFTFLPQFFGICPEVDGILLLIAHDCAAADFSHQDIVGYIDGSMHSGTAQTFDLVSAILYWRVRLHPTLMEDPGVQNFSLELFLENQSTRPQIVKMCKFLTEATVSFMENREISLEIISLIMDEGPLTVDALKALFRFIQVAASRAVETFFAVEIDLFDRIRDYVLEGRFELKDHAARVFGMILRLIPELFDAIQTEEFSGPDFLEDMLGLLCDNHMSEAICFVLLGIERYCDHCKKLSADAAVALWMKDSGPRFVEILTELQDFEEEDVAELADSLLEEMEKSREDFGC
jgi:hypothetical protein